MNIAPERAVAYLEREAIRQYAERLEVEGWKVEVEVPLETGLADLVASKGERKVVYEFKALPGGPSDPRWVAGAMQARRYAKEIGASFRLVAVQPPRSTEVQIAGIGEALLDALTDDVPPELVELSWDTRIDEVSDVSITALRIDGRMSVEVEGEGVISATLNAADDTRVDSVSLPFRFRGRLEPGDGPRITLEEAQVDTSFWFGDEAA